MPQLPIAVGTKLVLIFGAIPLLVGARALRAQLYRAKHIDHASRRCGREEIVVCVSCAFEERHSTRNLSQLRADAELYRQRRATGQILALHQFRDDRRP